MNQNMHAHGNGFRAVWRAEDGSRAIAQDKAMTVNDKRRRNAPPLSDAMTPGQPAAQRYLP
jgi:hypothetical protein